jgi:hypothetical protein
VIHKFFRSRGAACRQKTAKSNPSVRDRVGLVNAMLSSADGDVRLTISPRCKELIDDFEQVTYEEESTQIDKNRDRHRTHASDALGYLIWQEFRENEKVGERGQRLI